MAGFDIKGLNATALTEYAINESKNASATMIQNTIKNVSDKSSDDELWAACKSFEAYFLEQMFKEMQKSVDSLKPDPQDRSTSTLVDYFKGETLQDICELQLILKVTVLLRCYMKILNEIMIFLQLLKKL